jgi:hypothetical protein
VSQNNAKRPAATLSSVTNTNTSVLRSPYLSDVKKLEGKSKMFQDMFGRTSSFVNKEASSVYQSNHETYITTNWIMKEAGT